MVVIVITAPSNRDTNDSNVTFRNTVKLTEEKETLRTDSRESTGPPSYDSGVNTDSDTKDLKLFLRENKFVYDKTPRLKEPFSPNSDSTGEYSLSGLELCSKDSGFCNQGVDTYLEYQKLRDLELLKQIHGINTQKYYRESPISKDSGISDKQKGFRISDTPSDHRSSNDNDNHTVTYLSYSSSQADPDNSIATTKEEEWVTKKKVELTTKRQIETRVKRQVVLEDGKVVEDSGPIVTTNTTEDTEKQEHNQTEHRTSGDDPPGEDWVTVPGPGGLVKEVKERLVKSREETEERLETEDIQNLGDISDEGYLKAIQSGESDVRNALQVSSRGELVKRSPRIVHQSSKTRKVIDTEDKQELSEVQPDGKLVTETRRTTEHEVLDNINIPDKDGSNAPSIEEEVRKESSHRYRKTKEQDSTEYRLNGVKIGQKMRYQAETAEGERFGDPPDLENLDSLSTRIRRMRLRSQNHKYAIEGGPAPIERKDALTKKPLNFDQEEETRKVETSKWLEHHFGSESTRSSKGSLDEIDGEAPTTQNSFINVTMKSRPIRSTSPKRQITSPTEEETLSKPYKKVHSSREIFASTPESNSPTQNGYFHGISQWTNRKNEEKKEYSTVNETEKRVNGHSETLPPESPPSPLYHITSHQINPVQLKSSNLHSSTSRLVHERSQTSAPLDDKPKLSPFQSSSTNLINSEKYSNRMNGRSSPKRGRGIVNGSQFPSVNTTDRASSPVNLHKVVNSSHSLGYIEDNKAENEYPSPPIRRKQKEPRNVEHENQFRSWDRRQNKLRVKEEPRPDYSPEDKRMSRTPSPVGIQEDITTIDIPPNKKLYQRTRFAADIPPPPRQPAPAKPQKSNKFSESFRKFVGKFRSNSDDRKIKKRLKNGASSRSPSPKEATYQQYNVIDNNIPCVAGRVGRRGNSSGESGEEPVVPPRGRQNNSRQFNSLVDSGTQTSRLGGMERKTVQRYYLGEDPFAGSIYGREKEYDGVTPIKTSRKHRISNVRRTNGDDLHTSTLGRLSKSTSRLAASEIRGPVYDYDRGGVQTLPRKLREESRMKKQVFAQRSLGETHSSSTNNWDHSNVQQTNRYNTKLSRSYGGQGQSGSMINVSIVNPVTSSSSTIGISKPNGYLNGPAKPARTYKANLLRSKSFNVQVGDADYKSREPYKSNPQLHRLDESQELKSPGIISSLNRSSRDISDNNENNPFQFPNHTPVADAKRKIFMKGLLDRAPELFKTLHGDEIDGTRNEVKTPTRIYTSTPIKNGNSFHKVNGISHKLNGKVDYSNSFRSSSTNTNDSKGSRHLSSPFYKPSLLTNGHANDRLTSPSPKSSLMTPSPSFKEVITNGNTTRSVIRRGSSSNDDYSETVRITSKSDDPIRPSQTDTVQTFSKKTIPTKNGLSTETIESSKTKTVTKSHYRGGEDHYSGKYSRSSPGGVVIEVRNSRN